MDPQTPSPVALESLNATLHNTTVDKAERNEFKNTAHSHPYQGARTLLFQRSLVSPAVSLTLPLELVEHILLLLDIKSTLKCRLVNRQFNAIIQSSILVQYHLACDAAGVIDNPRSSLSYAERLEALKKREDAWRKLEPMFETTIRVNDQPLMSYELTAGKYFLADKNGKDLCYCHLPSSAQDYPQWLRVPGHGPKQSWSGSIIEMGMAIYEHDLITNVISSEVGNQADMQWHSLDLVLLKFSTREYHPLASHPLIYVQRSSSAQPYISVRIVGDNLALIVYDGSGSQLFIFDWKTGHRRLQHKPIGDAYKDSVPVFISPELLLVPNLILHLFELWHLYPFHANHYPVQILFLSIPGLSDNYTFTSIRCHGELNPFLHSVPSIPPRPFFPSSENSIITVNLRLRLRFLPVTRSAYKLIIDRRALLDMIQKWTSPSALEQQLDLPTWSTNEATVHKVADPDDGSVRLGVQSKLILMMPHPRFSPPPPILTISQISPASPSYTSAESSYSSISSGSVSSTLRYDILHIWWADWGPPISRWFQVDGTQTLWNNQSTGQRYVFLDRNPGDNRKCTIGVADFNLHNVRRYVEMKAQVRGRELEGEHNSGNDTSGEGKKEENKDELEKLDHGGAFREEVYMGLKCVVNHVPSEYDFDGVFMDEERLLGLKFDDEGRYESIKVLYFG